MSRLGLLQWYGVVGGGIAWALQLVLGFAGTQRECGAGGMASALGSDAWQLALLVVGVLAALGAEGAAAVVFLRTREVRDDDPPPRGRQHFLAGAALVANLLFITMILLGGLAAIAGALCRPA